jgi:hypothetical protein
MNELELNLGAQASYADNKGGRLAKVAVVSDTRQVTHIIVEAGLLLKHAHVFPISTIDWATPNEIHLSIKADEVGNYPEYREEVIQTPAIGQATESVEVNRATSPIDQGAISYTYAQVTGLPAPQPTVQQKVRFGVPEESALIDRSTPIVGPEGSLGKLDHLLVNTANGGLAGLGVLIAQEGVASMVSRAIPISMVKRISERGVSISATKEELEGLPENA